MRDPDRAADNVTNKPLAWVRKVRAIGAKLPNQPAERSIRRQRQSLVSEVDMRKSRWIVAAAALVAAPAMAQTPIPDLRGTWKGESESIVAGAGNPHHPGSSALRLGSVSFTLTIDNQDGRRFSGKFSSPRQTEQIIGVISRDSRVFAVDSDGYTFGTILAPDRVELCYLQLAAKGRVASCTEFKKQS